VNGRTQALRLPDRRRLGYLQLGASGGLPVLWCHGGLSCSLELGFADALARRLDVRLVAPDRPGIGASDFQPGRRLLDWPRDVEALADALGLERFTALGWSAGGPYALACGRALGPRLERVVLLAGLARLDEPRDIARLGLATDRFLFRMSPRSPRLAALPLALARALPLPLLRRSFHSALRATGDADLPHLPPPTLDALVETFRASLRPGALGTAWDYRVLAGPWGFRLEDVSAEVQVWHGTGDRLLGPEHSERLAARLPRAVLHRLPGHGHFLPHRALGTILEALR